MIIIDSDGIKRKYRLVNKMQRIQCQNLEPVKNERKSNLELLRIVATFFVIVLHYNNAGSGGGLLYTAELAMHYHILLGFEMMAICAVNVFVMISGYFMCELQKVDISKPLLLYTEVIIFSVFRYVLNCVTTTSIISASELIDCLIPRNWYVAVYVALYLISPYLNKIIHGMTALQFRTMLIVGILLFSVWPSVLDFASAVTGKDLNSFSSLSAQGSGDGYTIVNFALMYFLGAFERKVRGEDGGKKAGGMYLMVYMLCVFLLILYARLSFSRALSYCNLIVIIEAVSIFKVFKSIRIRSTLINSIAGCTFGVYLLHTCFFRYAQIERFVTGSIAIIPVHLLISSLLIFSISAIVYWVYSHTLRHVLNKWMRKLRFISYEVT